VTQRELFEEMDPLGLDQHDPGAKLDAGKATYSLVLRSFPKALAEVDAVARYGALKYSLDGWKSVEDGAQRYTEALLRHIVDEVGGETVDPKTDLVHAAQTAWNALARLELLLDVRKDD
jgi:hypothetical protein